MENLLVPETCMDVIESPLNFDNGDDVISLNDNKDKEKENEEAFVAHNPNQIPADLTLEEVGLSENLFGKGQLQVQYSKIHCTSCNAHLGSAPEGLKNRYVHPLLHVLICKKCFDFYRSGEFDKDEDGSELYCRWCGQGGKVLCCSQCSYVFCTSCLKKNLGKKKLDEIKALDDWLCLVCDSSQLQRLKILCYRLYQYTQVEVNLAEQLKDPSILRKDSTLCCNERVPQKRKSAKRDEDYTPIKFGTKSDSSKKNIFSSENEEDEVVCTPDLSFMDMNADASPLKSIQQDHSYLANLLAQPKHKLKANGAVKKFVMVKKGVLKPLQPKIPQSTLANGIPQLPPLTPIPAIMTDQQKNVIPYQTISYIPLVTKPNNSAALVPDDWFAKIKKEVAATYNKLSNEINYLTNKKSLATTVTELTSIHNSLQELLSTSINSFYSIRKNLKTNFLNDMRTTHTSQSQQKYVFVNKLPNPVAKPKPSPNQVRNPLFKPRIKVKSLAELSSVPAECIVIPDDEQDEVQPLATVGITNITTIDDEGSKEITDLTDSKTENDKTAEATSEKQPEPSASLNPPENDTISFDPSTMRLIKYALLESKIDHLIQSNLPLNHLGISRDAFKKMISVKVLIQNKFRSGTLRTHPKKFFKPMSLKKYNTVVNNTIVKNHIENVDKSKKYDTVVKNTIAKNHNKNVDKSKIGADESNQSSTNKNGPKVTTEHAPIGKESHDSSSVEVLEQTVMSKNNQEHNNENESKKNGKSDEEVGVQNRNDEVSYDEKAVTDDEEANEDDEQIDEVEDDDEEMPETEDVEDILGGSILLKNASALQNNFGDILSKFVMNSDDDNANCEEIPPDAYE